MAPPAIPYLIAQTPSEHVPAPEEKRRERNRCEKHAAALPMASRKDGARYAAFQPTAFRKTARVPASILAQGVNVTFH